MSVIGKRIALRRRALGISQEELAARLETNQRQISRYERGVNDPTVSVLLQFAHVLNTTPNYLLGLTENPAGDLDVVDLNSEEVELLSAFRSKAEEDRHRIVEIVKLF